MPDDNVGLAMIDGRDAILLVLVKPGGDDEHVKVLAHCNGMDKGQAAGVLEQVAASWRREMGER